MTTDVLIQVTDLQKHFKGGKQNQDEKIRALDGVSTEIHKGEVVVVIGPSGSGKSTFLRCLSLLELPTGGQILFDGVDITDKNCNINLHRQKMGMVFQHFNLFPHMTILKNMTIAPMQLLHKSKEKAEKTAMELLGRVGLADRANAYPSQLSGGQKQRVALAGVLALSPDILVFDEATAMLDPDGRQEVLRTIRRLHTQQRKTVVMITHYIEEAIGADRVYLIHNGKMIADGTAREMLTQPELLAAAGLTPPMPVQMYYDLKQAGIVLARCPLTLEELAEELCRSQ